MTKQFIVTPQVENDIIVGSPGQHERVLIGRLAESGPAGHRGWGAAGAWLALRSGAAERATR